MSERPRNPQDAPEASREPLFSAAEIRVAFGAAIVGMAGLLVVILLLASSRPQGAYQAANDAQYRDLLNAAAENLDGYERVGEDRARIDIDRAIDLVAERGVGLSMTALDAPARAQAPAGGEAAAGDGEAAGEADGQTVFDANCASCHQANGQGVPGAFPPLANGHMPALATAEGGRAYLLHVMLYGLQGPIEVNGQGYDGVMPAWSQLSDAEIAAVLNHELTSWDNAGALPDGFEPIAAEEVADARGQDLDPQQVHEQRPEPVAPAADAGVPAGEGDGGGPDDGAATDEAPATEETEEAPADEATGDAGGDAEAGSAAYDANCASCHQPNGQGVPGAFPPLAEGHMPALLAADGGRTYLVNVLLYGLQGQIEVQGQSYAGVMPAWGQLDDATIAAVLNHELTAWGNDAELGDGFEPIAADEVAAARDQDLSPADVLELRPSLD